MPSSETIAFIGGGNMAECLIGGLIASGHAASAIRVGEPDAHRRGTLAERHGIEVFADNAEAVRGADAVVLAVKPQTLQEVCRALGPVLARGGRPLVVSIAAGIRAGDMERWLGGDPALIRVMPNTPSLLGVGASALYANARVTEAGAALAQRLMETVGLAVWLDDESWMDIVTGLSGSGPAYFFLIIEALEEAAHELGLAPETARLLCRQTALGAATMAAQPGADVTDLRRRVTSPGGTTERGLQALEDGGVRGALRTALEAARDRAQELADQLGGDSR